MSDFLAAKCYFSTFFNGPTDGSVFQMTGKRLGLVSLLGVLSCGTSALAQPNPGPPADYQSSARQDLSGLWDFRLDDSTPEKRQEWFKGPYGEGWIKMAVPGSFNEQLATNPDEPLASDKMRFFRGAGWYHTTFASPPQCTAASKLVSSCVLHLSGTVLTDTVWLNGKPLGKANLPYLDQSYDLTNLLKQSDEANDLVIEVQNTLPDRGIPDTNWHGWWNDGGLIRPVYLEVRPQIHGQSYVKTTMTEAGWLLDVTTGLDRQPSTRARVSYELTDGAGRVIWHSAVPAKASPFANGEVHAHTNLASRVRPWSPESPALYTLTTTINHANAVDVSRIKVGFRQIETKGTQIYLNGAPYTIRGVSRHQFLAGVGMSMTIAEDRKDIEDIKALGANFVRLAHYSQSQDVYDACDELGLLVWTEIPAWQSSLGSLSDESVWEDAAKPQLNAMVTQHRNHPSVVIWSVANEIPSDKPEAAAYVAKAIAYVKSLDKSRLVTFASDRRLTDISFGSVDLIAINEYFGWYYGKQDDVGPVLDELHAKYPDKPIVVSEFGADAVADWRPETMPSGSRNYSYEAQSAFLAKHMDQIFDPRRRSFVAGGLVWVYNDFLAPDRFGGDQPASAPYRNNKGLVTMNRVHKPSYDVCATFFHQLAKRQEVASQFRESSKRSSP